MTPQKIDSIYLAGFEKDREEIEKASLKSGIPVDCIIGFLATPPRQELEKLLESLSNTNKR